MGIQINWDPDLIRNILPKAELFPAKNIWDSIGPPNGKNFISPLVNNLLPSINKIQMNWIILKLAFIDGKEIPQEENPENDYSEFLAYPNREIKNLVATIVESNDSNDMKAYKVMRWVQDNIEYISDLKNYGQLEWWTTPMETIKNDMSGDCEDGAFLIHSLMLNAGIPWDRVRTYGGSVMVGQGAATGGHGWTAYKREIDDEWVVLDWCYYPNQQLVEDRTPMESDLKYIDDWFYINTQATVETPYTNKVRDPGAMAYNTVPVREFVVGQRVNFEA